MVLTYEEQVEEHLNFLLDKGFNIARPHIYKGNNKSDPFIKFKTGTPGKTISYKTVEVILNNGQTGLTTRWATNKGVEPEIKLTRGLGENESPIEFNSIPKKYTVNNTIQKYSDDEITKQHREAAKSAYGVFINRPNIGQSEYLRTKGVGVYGDLRNDGDWLYIPVCDINGKIWNYQKIDANGNKRTHANARVKGLMHFLKKCDQNTKIIGIAEGYATAATIYELRKQKLPMVCMFGGHYSYELAINAIRKKYPKAEILIFADNDRHNEENGERNRGLESAQKAAKSATNAIVIVPNFGATPPSKSASDFNDLVRIYGKKHANKQINEQYKAYHQNKLR